MIMRRSIASSSWTLARRLLVFVVIVVVVVVLAVRDPPSWTSRVVVDAAGWLTTPPCAGLPRRRRRWSGGGGGAGCATTTTTTSTTTTTTSTTFTTLCGFLDGSGEEDTNNHENDSAVRVASTTSSSTGSPSARPPSISHNPTTASSSSSTRRQWLGNGLQTSASCIGIGVAAVTAAASPATALENLDEKNLSVAVGSQEPNEESRSEKDNSSMTESTHARNQDSSSSRVQRWLHEIPTFTLVDDEGVPFMVVGEDAKVTGYFFTTYREAQRILQLATRSADRALREQQQQQPESSQSSNPWKLARISTVPLDVAVALTLQSKRSRSRIRNYFQVAAAAQDIDDALSVSGRDDLPEGPVPLFYYADFVLPPNANHPTQTQTQTPVYFGKVQLEKAFRQAHPGTPLPECQVTELFALVTTMAQPNEDAYQNIVLVPSTDSVRRAQECQQQWQRRHSKDAPPFVLGQRNIVL